jgi:hypothetical protein
MFFRHQHSTLALSQIQAHQVLGLGGGAVDSSVSSLFQQRFDKALVAIDEGGFDARLIYMESQFLPERPARLPCCASS